ncbi:hypothetical protein MTP99_011891 [Tenebrio molitor]|nr:hypothetical protein MTP99_011891 [Tenebrio molitor]
MEKAQCAGLIGGGPPTLPVRDDTPDYAKVRLRGGGSPLLHPKSQHQRRQIKKHGPRRPRHDAFARLFCRNLTSATDLGKNSTKRFFTFSPL